MKRSAKSNLEKDSGRGSGGEVKAPAANRVEGLSHRRYRIKSSQLSHSIRI